MAQKLIELKIGERFDYNGVTLEVVKQADGSCNGCYLWMKSFCHNTSNDIVCCPSTRRDSNFVIFKEITK